MIRVLFVCLGNICRSPLAQGVFEKKIRELGWESRVYCDSAGISGWHEGEPPHSGSLKIAEKYDLLLKHQKSRPVRSSDNSEFDYFIAMDRSNALSLDHEFGIPRTKIFLMRDFENTFESNQKDVPDPYGRSGESFEDVYQILERSMDGFVQFLKDKHSL